MLPTFKLIQTAKLVPGTPNLIETFNRQVEYLTFHTKPTGRIHNCEPQIWRVKDPHISHGEIWDKNILLLKKPDFVKPDQWIFSKN